MSDLDSVYNHIRKLGQDACQDMGWGSKQDLYRLKELVDSTLSHCPTYLFEDQWLTQREKQRIIHILKTE
jgi:hypothetical protein